MTKPKQCNHCGDVLMRGSECVYKCGTCSDLERTNKCYEREIEQKKDIISQLRSDIAMGVMALQFAKLDLQMSHAVIDASRGKITGKDGWHEELSDAINEYDRYDVVKAQKQQENGKDVEHGSKHGHERD